MSDCFCLKIFRLLATLLPYSFLDSFVKMVVLCHEIWFYRLKLLQERKCIILGLCNGTHFVQTKEICCCMVETNVTYVLDRPLNTPFSFLHFIIQKHQEGCTKEPFYVS